MFLVSDGSRDGRKKIILGLAAKDKAVGLLLSVVDFEWTVRRAILMLSTAPTKTIRNELVKCHGPDAYKKAWGMFVKKDRGCSVNVPLSFVVNGSANKKGSKKPWDLVKDAFEARHRLVHGVSGFIKDADAERHMLNMFSGTDALAEFAAQSGGDVFKKIKARKSSKEGK